jgi:hypothetical protein
MIATLQRYLVKDVVLGFEYNEFEGKGLFGLNGNLIIQPEYQRNYIYAEKNREAGVIDSLIKGYPLGLIYFNRISSEKYGYLMGNNELLVLVVFLPKNLQSRIKMDLNSIFLGCQTNYSKRF